LASRTTWLRCLRNVIYFAKMIIIESAKDSRDATLSALADPTRRRVVELLAGKPMTAGELHAAFPIAAPAVSRHLRVLRDAGLITEVPVSDRRVRLYTLSPEPLGALSAWVDELSRSWQSQLDSFKDYIAMRSAHADRPR
jgi:DNA-binding transcriptional ArsR family regulator